MVQTLRKILSYRYEIIAFLAGASVMIMEIVGARLMAPKFGASLYVWTAMIGVILGSLAIGYAVGGKIADKRDTDGRYLSFILFAAAMMILVLALIQDGVLNAIASHGFDLRLSAFLSAILLFGMPSALLGMVSPHLAKVRLTSLDNTGFTIGRLEASGALGSIIGTFSCGYFLLGMFGSRGIILGVVVMLLLTSFLAERHFLLKFRLYGFAALLIGGFISLYTPPGVLADVDSSYARYRVVRQEYGSEPINTLITDAASIQSASYADGQPGLILDYTRHFFTITKAYGEPKRVLVVGGGTHTFPSALIRSFPDVEVDVVEIDPALDGLAKEYFALEDSPRLTIHHADGRQYLNSTTTKYDIIFMDAFSSLSPPFHLTTVETVKRIHDRLNPDGVAVINVIGTYDGGSNDYLRAVQATYSRHFRNLSLQQSILSLPLTYKGQNFALVASNNAEKFAALEQKPWSPRLALHGGGLVLTDDFAPIERFTH